MDASSESEATPANKRTGVERKSERELVVTRVVNAPARLVFEAWTKADLFKRWWVPKSYGLTLLSCDMDVRVGGQYRLVFPHEGSTMEFFGTYLEVNPYSRLVWTNEEGADGKTITTVTFDESAGKTRLVVHDLYPSKEALDSGSMDAMPETLDQLDAFLASQDRSSKEASPKTKVTPFLMFNDQLEAAMAFYTVTFPDSHIRSVARTGQDGPIESAEFVVGGQRFMGYNGGPHFSFSEGTSFYVDCEDQAEVDAYWDKLVKAGATPTACGWIKDPFGLSWQIVPRRFMELVRDKDPRKVKAVMDAMMTMVKLDVAALEKAYLEA